MNGWMDGGRFSKIDRAQKREIRAPLPLPRCYSDYVARYRLPYSFSPSFKRIKRMKKTRGKWKVFFVESFSNARNYRGRLEGGSVIGNCDRHLDRRQETFPLLFSATPISSLAGFLVEPVPRSDVTRSSSWIFTFPLGYRRELLLALPPRYDLNDLVISRNIDEIMKRSPLRCEIFLFEFNSRNREREEERSMQVIFY